MRLSEVSPTRILVQLHRWLGVCLCLMFALWFASGAILMYVPFPALADEQRLAHLDSLDLSKITVAPAAAVAAAGVADIDRVRLIELPDRPAYVVHPTQGPVVAVAADSGEKLEGISAADAGQIAARFAGRPVQSVEGPLDYDQWIVHQRFDPYRPLFRVPVGDEAGTVLYVSARSGDVLQRTHRAERIWNYFGAVVHWIYPTFLRKSWAAWDSFVWWLSLVGIVMAVAGMWLGLLRTAKSMRNPRNPSISPFRRWFRWHHLTGLAAGIFLLTWIFSGWLSMDHGRLFSSGAATPEQLHRYRGLSLEAAAAQVSAAQLAQLGAVAEAEIVALDGHAYWVGRRAGTGAELIGLVSNDAGMLTSFPDALLTHAVQSAWPGSAVTGISAIRSDDAYGRLITEPLPESTRRIVVGQTPQVWVHVDATSGRIVQVMDRSRRIYRWLFYGLHTFDVPGLSTAGIGRQLLMLSLLALGFLLSVTGAVLGTKRIHRTFGAN